MIYAALRSTTPATATGFRLPAFGQKTRSPVLAQPAGGSPKADGRKLSRRAGEGNRTLVLGLENRCSAIELHPQKKRQCTGHAARSMPFDFTLSAVGENGIRSGQGGIRTPVLIRGQIYSLVPLAARPPARFLAIANPASARSEARTPLRRFPHAPASSALSGGPLRPTREASGGT
jgi:hypothetical protein